MRIAETSCSLFPQTVTNANDRVSPGAARFALFFDLLIANLETPQRGLHIAV